MCSCKFLIGESSAGAGRFTNRAAGSTFLPDDRCITAVASFKWIRVVGTQPQEVQPQTRRHWYTEQGLNYTSSYHNNSYCKGRFCNIVLFNGHSCVLTSSHFWLSPAQHTNTRRCAEQEELYSALWDIITKQLFKSNRLERVWSARGDPQVDDSLCVGERQQLALGSISAILWCCEERWDETLIILGGGGALM